MQNLSVVEEEIPPQSFHLDKKQVKPPLQQKNKLENTRITRWKAVFMYLDIISWLKARSRMPVQEIIRQKLKPSRTQGRNRFLR